MTVSKGIPSLGGARLHTLAALLILAGLTYLFLWRLWAPTPAERATFPEKSDLTEVFFPARYFAAATLRAGELPLWNPHSYSGYPQYADPQAATFYPIALAWALWAGDRFSLDTLAANIGLHYFLAGVFTFFFLRQLTGRALPALLGAITFEFSGVLTGFAPLQVSELEAAVWLPATLWALTATIHRRSAWLAAAAGALFGLVFLVGRPQSYLFIAPVCLGWLAHYGRARGVTWRTIAGYAGLLVSFALGLAAVQWLPTLELTRLSTRAALSYSLVSQGGFGFEELAALFAPGLVGSTPIFVTLYAGAVALLLVGLAVYRRQGLFWAALALVFLLGSLGRHLILFDAFYLVERLGFPGYLRDVERLALGVNFCVAVLAALGLDQLARERDRLPRRLAGLAAVLFLAALVAGGLQSWGRPPSDLARIAQALTVLGLILASGLLSVWLSGHNRLAAQMALLGLAAVDVMTLNGGRFYVVGQTLQANEVAHMAQAPAGRSPFYRVAADQLTAQDFGSLLGLDNIGGMTSLRLQTYQALLDSVDNYRRNILLNVEVVATSGEFSDPAFHLAGTWQDFRYYDFLAAHPRAYFVQNVVAAQNMNEAAALVAAPEFDHWNAAVVVAPPALAAGPPVDASETVEITRRTANAMRLTVNAAAERMLVIAAANYPGWTARLDGRPVPIYQTNVALQGVVVPAGAHMLELRFAPTLFYVGAALSALTLVILVGWAVVLRRPAKR